MAVNITTTDKKKTYFEMLQARVAERIDALNKKINATESENGKGGFDYHHRSIAELLTTPGAITQDCRNAACKLVMDGLRAKITEAQAESKQLDNELAEWIKVHATADKEALDEIPTKALSNA